jgi:hypothetical protein
VTGRAFLLVLGVAACGGEENLQLVTGILDLATFPRAPVEVRAARGDIVVGAGPVAAGGSFLLAIPTGNETHLEIMGAEGEPIARVARALPGILQYAFVDVCEPRETLRLGPIALVQDACFPSAACIDAQAALGQCYLELDLEPGPKNVESCAQQEDDVDAICGACTPASIGAAVLQAPPRSLRPGCPP